MSIDLLLDRSNFLSEPILTLDILLRNMRGRWASAALGAGLARRRASYEIEQHDQANEAQMQQAQRQIDAQQRQIESLQQQKQSPQLQQEDLTQKLKQYGDLRQQGILTEEEFQRLKADLLSKI